MKITPPAKPAHGFTTVDNPYCQDCGLRMYPQWGGHDCTQPTDLPRARHIAGDIISNLHFWRLDAEMQIVVLTEALTYTLARNVHPMRLTDQMHDLWPNMELMVRRAVGGTIETMVRDISKRTLYAKKKTKKGDAGGRRPAQQTSRSHRQALSTRTTRR